MKRAKLYHLMATTCQKPPTVSMYHLHRWCVSQSTSKAAIYTTCTTTRQRVSPRTLLHTYIYLDCGEKGKVWHTVLFWAGVELIFFLVANIGLIQEPSFPGAEHLNTKTLGIKISKSLQVNTAIKQLGLWQQETNSRGYKRKLSVFQTPPHLL